MGTIYEKIKASKEASALKANAALISGAADAAPTYQDLSTKGGKKPVKSEPIETKEEKKDDTNVDDVVNTDENNENVTDKDVKTTETTGSPVDFVSPAKSVKDEIKTSMGEGIVRGKYGNVTETKTTEEGKVGEYSTDWDEEKYGPYKEWIKKPGNKEKEDKFINSITTPGKETKKYTVDPIEQEVETKTPGTKSNYNMGWAESVNAKWAEGVQRRDSKQDLRQYNRELKRFDKGGLFSKKGSDMINPATGKAFTSDVEYADFQMGKSGDRGADGNMDATQEFNQKVGTRRGRNTEGTTESTTSVKKFQGTPEEAAAITHEDSETTLTAKVTGNADNKTKVDEKKSSAVNYNSPTKFSLKKKSQALNNFKYKK